LSHSLRALAFLMPSSSCTRRPARASLKARDGTGLSSSASHEAQVQYAFTF
jgi:hypothetical protein